MKHAKITDGSRVFTSTIEGPSGKRGHVPFEILILLKTEWLVLAI